MKIMRITIILLLAATTMALRALPATEYHVAITGNDANPGTQAAPLRTIQRAADLAQPGDTVTVHAGVYREYVNPPRGGESDTRRIVYQAAAGEQVVITGSEAVKKWEKVRDDVWKATLPNTFFGNVNPFAELIAGDWFDDKGRSHHAGAVYLNGHWLAEAVRLEEVLKPITAAPLWFATVDTTSTVIWAQFKGVDPNEQRVEVNARQTVFYPDKPGRNFITVRGFTLRNAATPWAPPTVEQIGLIGVHWSKGWIIENNDIAYSTCSGITLGKYGEDKDHNTGSATGYVTTIERALKNGWNKETIGHHMVRNNHIAHCEQAGIVGSLGAAFSIITGNTIHDIHVRQLFSGAEMAGIKFHGPIDATISGNHIYRTCRGIWLDWMTQGTRITNNLCHDNEAHDLMVEANHGPFVVDNNIFLSPKAIEDPSQGGAYAHNLIAGVIDLAPDFFDGRETPFHKAHSTEIVALHDNPSGDSRYYNNLFMGSGSLEKYDQAHLPMGMDGNVFFQGAKSSKHENAPINRSASDPALTLVEKSDGFYLTMTLAAALGSERPSQPVTSARLGKAGISGCAFENPDGSPITIGTDYFGKPRNAANPTPGPFEAPGTGTLTMKVWPLTVGRKARLMAPAANAVDNVPNRLPGIPTNASPYSDYAPYLCYPGSDKYYSFPGIRDPWVFNRAMVWLEQKDGVDGPPICYSGGESVWLSGKQQASIWRGGTITENADNSTTFSAALADEGGKLPFFAGTVDPEIMKLSIGHACTSPFQFNLEQHPKAILEVTDASAPWRFMVVLKGREGKPSYICDWKTGAGKLEVDLRRIYRTLGYEGNFAHVYFLLSLVGPQDSPKSATFKLHMAGEGAVISSLPVIRTDQRQRREGVPLACIVVDEQARKLGEGTVAVKARVNGKTYAMKETGGIWRTLVRDLPVGDHRASLEAEWLGGKKKRVAMLDVSVTDGKFIGFDSATSLLTYNGKPMPPMTGSETGKLIYRQPDTPNESLVCGEKEWSEVVAAAKGGNLDIADRWWEGLNEKDQEKQAEYLASCGFNLMHLSSWWHHWERTEYLDHVAPYGVERLAGTLRANRKHGVFLYFNLANHHPTEDGCVPYQQQVDAGIQKWSYAVNSGWVKTYMGYAAAFARLFSDETSLLAVSANGERDRDTRTGTLDFVNQTYDIYRVEDPNHLVITEFDVFDNPMAVTAFKPEPAGFRTYTCHDRDRPYAELNIRLISGKYKAEMMRPHPYRAEGNFWGFLPTELHGFEGDSYTHNRDQGKLLQSAKARAQYRSLTREETYLALVYRMSMCMSWGECIIEDERKVHQDVRQRVNWTQEWKPAPVAIRVKTVRDRSKEPDLFGCARLIDEPYNYEEKMNALSLETTYLWGNSPVPDGVAHVIDLNKQSRLNPAFSSDGGDLPDWLKDLRPIVVPGGQTHYLWSRDGRTFLAYLPGQIPGSTIKLQGFPEGSLSYRLYDLDKKEVVATGRFQKSRALTLPEKGYSFFLLVTP